MVVGFRLLCELHSVPGDHRVHVQKTREDSVLCKGRDPERRGRFGKQMAAAIALNVDGDEV